MSKPKSIQINIHAPCSQNWDEMTASPQGRFCDHCHKTIIDFTSWSDTALYNFFSKNTQHVCGRFHFSQVDRPINIPYQPHSRLYRITVAMGLSLLFIQTPHLLAQNRPPKTEQTSLLKQADPTNNLSGEIAGRVLDYNKEPLISAVIQIYQGDILKGGTVTDFDGNYLVKPLQPGYYKILVTYTGLDSVTMADVIVASGQRTTVNFTMQSNRNEKGRKYQKPIIMGLFRQPVRDKYNPTKKPLPAKN